MRRIRIVFAVLALALLVPTGLLVRRALESRGLQAVVNVSESAEHLRELVMDHPLTIAPRRHAGPWRRCSRSPAPRRSRAT